MSNQINIQSISYNLPLQTGYYIITYLNEMSHEMIYLSEIINISGYSYDATFT